MKIATWNVNSVNSRLQHLLKWLDAEKPDIALLQETKTIDEKFPALEIEDRGYNIAMHGQKSYNGVAILSKFPLDDVVKSLPGDENDDQARYIEAVASLDDGAIRVASIYVPNGQSPDSDKFQYKMRFFDRLYAHAKQLLQYDEMLVLGGDYNCAPQPQDVYDPQKLDGTVCYHPREREKLRAIEYLGFYDAFRMLHTHKQQFSFWDYRGGAYQAGKGYRIDHLLLSPHAADILKESHIDETPRRWQKPSDHAPVVALLG